MSPQLSASIRHATAGWYAISDPAHTPQGIASVQTLADRVRVHYSFTPVSITSVQATPDDQFAAAAVRVGVSVGLTYVDVFFYMGTSQTPVNPALLTRANANVWLTGWFL